MGAATYKCLRCASVFKYSWPPGGSSGTECIQCGHLYLKWMDYGPGQNTGGAFEEIKAGLQDAITYVKKEKEK